MKDKAEDAALRVMANGVTALEGLSSSMVVAFPYATLGEARAAFEAETKSAPKAANATLAKSIGVATDAVSSIVSQVHTLKTFIALSLPAIEDGNNFGVSIQLQTIKAMDDATAEIVKLGEEVPKYYAARADAVDKLDLEKTAKTASKTETSSQSSSKGGKEGDEAKQSSNVSTEEKTTQSGKSSIAEVDYHRLQHLVSLDVQLYDKLRNSMQSAVLHYAVLLDNVEKNYVKLSKPKGNNEGRSSSNMMC